jgi:hypothetical protein
MTEEKETVVVTLIFPNGYAHQLNEVASVTTRNVVFLKRKLLSSSGSELVKYPLTEVANVDYRETRPILRLIFGALLTALILFIFVMIYVYWDRLEPGTRIYVGLFAIAGFYGVRLLTDSRISRLTFRMRDGSKLAWKSKPGDFKIMRDSALRILDFAKQRGLAA